MDYGLGNIKSLFNSLKKIGFNEIFFQIKKINNLIWCLYQALERQSKKIDISKKILRFFEYS